MGGVGSGRRSLPIQDRLLSRFIVDPAGCWLWTGSCDSGGYGRMSVGGRLVGVHRASYELHVGPIPEGLEIDHLCRVRKCMNPQHLEVVDRITNISRSSTPGAIALSTGYCQRGHAFNAENIYVYPSGKRQCRPCMTQSKVRNRGEG